MMITTAMPTGRWRFAEAVAWPREHLDLCGSAFLGMNSDGTGEMVDGALAAVVNTGFITIGIDIDRNGSDEGDQVQGTGWADLCDSGCLEAESAYDNDAFSGTGVPANPARTATRLDLSMTRRYSPTARQKGWQLISRYSGRSADGYSDAALQHQNAKASEDFQTCVHLPQGSPATSK